MVITTLSLYTMLSIGGIKNLSRGDSLKGRIKRKIVWEKKGVSEIVGTILMLAITVILFSSIIAWVGKIPPPRESYHVELNCYLEPAVPSDWGLGVNFTMRHQGGPELDQYFIKIYLTVDDTPLSFDQPDGLIDKDGDTFWGLGELWSQNITKGAGPGQVPTLSGPLNPSTFSVLVVNVEKNTIIWQETIGEGVNKFPPIIIDMWIDSDLGTPNVLDPGPISYTDEYKIYARVVDPEGFDPDYGLDVNNIWVSLTAIYGPTAPPVQMLDTVDVFDAVNDDIYVAKLDPPTIDDVSPGNYYFIFNATDLTQPTPMSTQKIKLFPVGMLVGDNPQIIVREINFDDPEPVNGDSIAISATLWNRGGAGALVDVQFFDGDTSKLIGTTNVSIAAQGEVNTDVDWLATPGGVHMIIVNATLNETYALAHNIYDPYLPDNIGFQNITVMPKILLVDDDSELNDMGPKDTVSFMRASLEAADYQYEFTIVGAGDGPGYDYGDKPLEDYDIVIWMTGYQTSNTLTNLDVDNLIKFLNAGTGVGNGGSLWFISQGFWEEATSKPFQTAFATANMHVQSMPPMFNASLPPELWGNATNPGHPVTDDFADNPIKTVNRATGSVYERSYWWDRDLVPIGTMALNSTDECYACSYDSDEAGDPVTDSRIYVQTWDFSRIEDTATQAQYTYKVIKWLGNITMKYTKDVAISEQTVSPEIVFYKQQVTVRFVIRNNGFENYTLQDDLYYRLRILDVNGNELQPPVLIYQQIDFLGYGKNNTRTYFFNWTPQEIGFHRLSIKVDPDNRISESNEWNNEISNYLSSGELFVQYRILVVDDDNSLNNNGRNVPGDPYNETAQISNALNFLNATGKYAFEQFVVDEGMGGHGPSYDVGDISLNKYNAVIWVAGDDLDPIDMYDEQNISAYLDHRGNLWLVGSGIWSSGDFPSTFEHNFLKINSVFGDDPASAATLRGVRDDPISHGMVFAGAADPFADTLTPEPGGIGFFYQDDAMTGFNSIRYSGPAPTYLTDCKVATTAWLLSSLNDNESKAEIVFMILRWFEKPEDRPEVRVTDMDVWLSDEHPQLGSGYVIQATIHNTGGAVANVLIRFMDGNTQIGSDSISVSPDQTTTAEIIWIPLYAGARTLNVLVDPIAEVDEIFEWSNNNATRDIYVYFFWDDMESGGGKWDHSSTIMLINGEEPLEYIYGTELDTNIITDWDYIRSIGVKPTMTTYHGFDSCYWLEEPPGGATGDRVPIDVVFALDTSGSMAGTPIVNLRDATKIFVGQLSDYDRCAIFTFDGGGSENCGAELQELYAYMTQTTKDAFNTTIDTFGANGYTCFYDTLGAAMQYSQTNQLPGRLEFVIGMTDGESNSDDYYTPNANWDTTVAPDNEYSTATPHPTQGLLYPPMMVYTVGLDIPHDMNYPSSSDDPPWSRTPPTPIDGIEYDVWHCADSSPEPLNDAGGKYGENETTGDDNVGHYYYTVNPTDLTNIFQGIFTEITQVQLEGENQTKGGGSLPGPQLTVSLFSETFTADDGDWRGDDSGETVPSQEWWYVEDNPGDTRVGNYDNVPDGRCVQIRDADGGWGGDYIEGRYNGGNNWFDLSGYAGSWYGYLNWSMRSVGCEGGDEWRVEVTRNGGGAWTTVAGPYGGNTPGSWTQYSYALQTADFASNQWGFRLNTNSGGDTDHHNFDDISIEVIYDPTSPVIVSTLPANGATGVNINQQIVVTFSERMDTSTVTYSCTPDPGGWVEGWSSGDRVLTLNHVDFDMNTLYTFEILTGQDMAGHSLNNTGAPNPWSFTTLPDTFNPYIISTDPIDDQTGVFPLDYPVVITFNESINTGTFNFSCTDDPGGWGASWSAGDSVVTLSHDPFNASTTFQFNVTYAEDLMGNFMTSTLGAPNPWVFTTGTDIWPPTIILTNPYDTQVNVPINLPVQIRFNEPIIPSSVTYTCIPDPGGWMSMWQDGNRLLSLMHFNFDINTAHQFHVTAAKDLAGIDLVDGAVPNPWSFTTGEEAIQMANFNKTAVTETMDLTDYESAKLSFWHKYNIMPGANGGFLQVGYKTVPTGSWMWRYVIPANAYTGNLRSSVWVNDSFGQRIYWCWNGVSGSGTFGWDYVSVDLLTFVPSASRGEVKVKFNYTQYGGGTGHGWYIDDVRVRVSRSDSYWPSNNTAIQDIWNLTNMTQLGMNAHSGDHSWSNVDPVNHMKPGIDNYLKTTPIDLTQAKNAYLSAYFKFNLNTASGAPPDGFRVEVSENGGISWTPINFGVRSSWGVSGTGNDIDDGFIDGRAYTGLCDSGNPSADDYWVEANTLSRVNVDLTSYSGNAIQIRFRVVTCSHTDYAHDAGYSFTPPTDEFFGFYVDDVIVYGETIITG
jgi:flagellin-like protein